MMPSMLCHCWQSTWEGSSLSQAETHLDLGCSFKVHTCVSLPSFLSCSLSCHPCLSVVGCEAMWCQASVCLLDRKPHPCSATHVHKASSLWGAISFHIGNAAGERQRRLWVCFTGISHTHCMQGGRAELPKEGRTNSGLRVITITGERNKLCEGRDINSWLQNSCRARS